MYVHSLEVVPVDSTTELLNWAALIHNVSRRILLQRVQQQVGQQEGPKVIGAQGDLPSCTHKCGIKIPRGNLHRDIP